MENSSSLEASDGVLKTDCNNIIPDLNATLLDASEVSPSQMRRKGKSQHKHIKTHPLLKQARALGPFLEIIKDVIKNWSLDYKESYVNILNNAQYENPNMKSFALFPTYSDKYMYKVWESKTKTPRDKVLFQRLQETVLFTYFKKPACKFDRTYCNEIFLKQESDPQFDKFEDLIAYFNNVFKNTVDKDDWRNSTYIIIGFNCIIIGSMCEENKTKKNSFDLDYSSIISSEYSN